MTPPPLDDPRVPWYARRRRMALARPSRAALLRALLAERYDVQAIAEEQGPVCHEYRGTSSGYKRHQRAGQKPCDECRVAHARDNLERTRRRQMGAA